MNVFKILKTKKTLPEDVLEAFQKKGIQDTAAIIRLQEGDHLVREKDPLNNWYVLVEGAVRGYRLDGSGRERTEIIVFKPGMTLVPSFSFTGLLPVNLQALTSSMVLCVPAFMMEKAARKDIRLQSYSAGDLRRHLKAQHSLTLVRFMNYTEERYRWFLSEYGEIASEVDIRTVASFLGITPESLSRVRSHSELGRQRHRIRTAVH